MKGFCLFVISLIYTLSLACAQTNYYPHDSGVARGDSVVMEYVTEFGERKVYNHDQRYVFVDRVRKDGQPMSQEVLFGKRPTFNGATIPIGQCYELVKAQLPEPLLEYLSQEVSYHFTININMDSQTGGVVDVYYSFGSESRYVSIPPEVLGKIEKVLRDNLRFRMTDEGRELNYCFFSWTINFHDNFLV
ncbi:MAG: DUF5043 domain-containing protein [Rikenellaceae bacterium]